MERPSSEEKKVQAARLFDRVDTLCRVVLGDVEHWQEGGILVADVLAVAVKLSAMHDESVSTTQTPYGMWKRVEDGLCAKGVAPYCEEVQVPQAPSPIP